MSAIETGHAKIIHGIAWDDDFEQTRAPEKMAQLKERLAGRDVHLSVAHEADGFRSLLQRGEFQFILLDLLEDIPGGDSRWTGLELLRDIRKLAIEEPVVLISGALQPLRDRGFELRRSEFLLSKRAQSSSLAEDLLKILEDSGARHAKETVLCINDGQSPGAAAFLEALRKRGYSVAGLSVDMANAQSRGALIHDAARAAAVILFREAADSDCERRLLFQLGLLSSVPLMFRRCLVIQPAACELVPFIDPLNHSAYKESTMECLEDVIGRIQSLTAPPNVPLSDGNMPQT